MIKPTPIAIFITDVHFTLNTLELAKTAFLRAQFKAKLLDVPLVIGGDTLDTKAVMRAEVVNTLINLLSVKDAPETIFLCGNHEMVNERSKEHSLHFLKPYATVIDTPQIGSLKDTQVLMIPYQTDPLNFMAVVNGDEEFPSQDANIVIAHQGLKGANAGEYILDRTAVEANELPNKKYIVGHYHTRQEVQLKHGGTWTFAGNPYSLTFAETEEKGYQILMSDGSLEFVPTNLRKHVVIEAHYLTDNRITISKAIPGIHAQDLVWIKLKGTREQLSNVTKPMLATVFCITQSFKLDLIPIDNNKFETPKKPLSNQELLDTIIDASVQTSDEGKARIKSLWRGMV